MEDRWKLARYFNFFIFIFLLAGVILGNIFSFFGFFAFLFIASFFSVWFLGGKRQTLTSLGVGILILSLGALLFISRNQAQKDKFLEGRPQVTIRVSSLPEASGNRNIFFAEVLNIEGYAQNFRVRVFDYSKKMEYLGKYRLKANLSKRIYQERTFYNLWVQKDAQIEELSLSFWQKATKRVNYYCLAVFERNCSLAAKNFLAAIFLGRRELLGQQQVFMRNAGLAHLLAISGLHIGLISLILFYFLRFFNLSFKVSLLISCFFLTFYAVVTGLRPSVQRAVIMYLIFAFGFLFKRKTEVLNSLGLAGTILLLFSPVLAYDLGFQLSFLAVFGIIIGFKLLPYKGHFNFLINYIKQIFLSSLFVFVFIWPLTAYYFNRIYFASPFYNLILIPLFTLILFLNFLLIIFSPLAFLAQGIGTVLSWLIYFFQATARFLGSLPLSYFSYSFNSGQLFLYYFFLCLVFLLAFLARKKKGLLYKENFVQS